MIAPPPWIIRRFVLAPAMVLLAIALVPTLVMLGLLVGAVITWVLPGRLRLLRLLWMIAFYIAWDALVIVVAFGMWVGSGFGYAIRRPHWVRAHMNVGRALMDLLFWQVRWTLRLKIVPEIRPGFQLPDVPLIVISRHAGPGDSLILVHQVMTLGDRIPAIVLNDFLQWDPAVDIMLHRLPVAFVKAHSRRKPGDPSAKDRIAKIVGAMGSESALVLFPEGGNVTPGRRLKRIQYLRDHGHDDLADRAEAMPHVMPPVAGGFLTALSAAPDAGVLVVAHTGLERLYRVSDLWRELPMDKTIILGGWFTEAADLPLDEEGREAWLFDQWVRVDAWIEERTPAGELGR